MTQFKLKAGASFSLGFLVSSLAPDFAWGARCDVCDKSTGVKRGSMTCLVEEAVDFATTGNRTLMLHAAGTDTEGWLLPADGGCVTLVSDIVFTPTPAGVSTEVVISSTFEVHVEKRITQ